MRHAPATLRMHMHQLLNRRLCRDSRSVRHALGRRVDALYTTVRNARSTTAGAHGSSRVGLDSSHTRTPSLESRVGMTRHPAPAWRIASISRRRPAAEGPPSRVSDPPSPPAPFTFHPQTP